MTRRDPAGPPNGDYQAYIDRLMSGKEKISLDPPQPAPTIAPAPEERAPTPAAPVPRPSPAPAAAPAPGSRGAAIRSASASSARATAPARPSAPIYTRGRPFIRLGGYCLLALGLLSIFAGINGFAEENQAIPIGMVMIFFGIVSADRGRARRVTDQRRPDRHAD